MEQVSIQYRYYQYFLQKYWYVSILNFFDTLTSLIHYLSNKRLQKYVKHISNYSWFCENTCVYLSEEQEVQKANQKIWEQPRLILEKVELTKMVTLHDYRIVGQPYSLSWEHTWPPTGPHYTALHRMVWYEFGYCCKCVRIRHVRSWSNMRGTK